MKVFFSKHQSSKDANSYSPSASKPALAVADWKKHGLIADSDVLDFEPLEDGTIALAHDPYYVSNVLSCRADNGFNNRSESIAHSLPYTSGSVLAAARHALKHGESVCSPSSGFHHAGYDFSGGYCTFNGLVITAAALRKENKDIKVGILDCDMHWGNGTADIIKRKKMHYVQHYTQGAVFHDRFDVGVGATKFFEWLAKAVYAMRGCDVVLYQAGADPHINDPLGGLLTTAQMIQRDQIVFGELKGKPLAWTLAGGYQRDSSGGIEPVLALHRNTVIECIKASQ